MFAYCVYLTRSHCAVDTATDCRSRDRKCESQICHMTFVETDHGNISTLIFPLPLIQEGQLSVSGVSVCTSTSWPHRRVSQPRKSVSRLNDRLNMAITVELAVKLPTHLCSHYHNFECVKMSSGVHYENTHVQIYWNFYNQKRKSFR